HFRLVVDTEKYATNRQQWRPFCYFLIGKSQGNYMFTAFTETNSEVVITIPERFRNAFYFAPGDFVLCSPVESKRIKGEIRALLREAQIRHLASNYPFCFWVSAFPKTGSNSESYSSVYLITDNHHPCIQLFKSSQVFAL
ncbi:unnamed protein product, partial [Echinostoma caproni]|uniref:S1-like domain-containing protein n=1 Tax=Echinostoma caproni TaxID=27848 RepID=A0A183BH34_9TREM